MRKRRKMWFAPVVAAFVMSVLFVMAAEAEASFHLLAGVWLSLAVTVLMLAISRFCLFRNFSQPKYENGSANILRTKHDRWGAALTASFIVTGLALVYFLD